jgi:hypothetical protein
MMLYDEALAAAEAAPLNSTHGRCEYRGERSTSTSHAVPHTGNIYGEWTITRDADGVAIQVYQFSTDSVWFQR